MMRRRPLADTSSPGSAVKVRTCLSPSYTSKRGGLDSAALEDSERLFFRIRVDGPMTCGQSTFRAGESARFDRSSSRKTRAKRDRTVQTPRESSIETHRQRHGFPLRRGVARIARPFEALFDTISRRFLHPPRRDFDVAHP